MLKLLVVLSSLLMLGCSGTQTETFRVPGSEMKVIVEKTHAHLFLAEYDFRLILEDAEKDIDSAKMTGDSGGLTRITVSKTGNSSFAFRDHARTVCLDLNARKFEECLLTKPGVEVGYLDFDGNRHWRFIAKKEYGGQ